MNKNIKLLCTLLVFVMLFGFIGTVTTLAEEKSLITLESSKDLRVHFEYDKEKPSIVFISPSGTRISSGNSKLVETRGKNWFTCLIKNAEAGEWKIEYDKKSNTTVSYTIIDSIDNVSIQSFKINHVKDDKVSVSFKADFPEGGRYDYEILAFCEGETEPITLHSSSAECGKLITTDVSLRYLSTTPACKLCLYVTMDNGNLFDQMYVDSFSYTNPNADEPLSDCKVYLNKRNSTISLNWAEAENIRSYSYLIYCTNKDGEETFRTTLDKSETKIIYSPDDTEVNIFICQESGGIWSKPLEKRVDLKSPYSLSFKTEDITSSVTGQIECKTDGKSSVYLEMAPAENSSEEEKIIKEIEINKDEIINFQLSEANTYVYAAMLAPDGIYYEDSLNIYLDSFAPTITLYEDYDRINVDKSSITIVGETGSGAVFSVNGKAQKISADGGFKVKLKLKMGENKFTLTSADKAGNTSERTIVITRVASSKFDSSAKGFISLGIGLVLSILVSVLAIVFFKKRKEG